jgi:hypothetical protein
MHDTAPICIHEETRTTRRIWRNTKSHISLNNGHLSIRIQVHFSGCFQFAPVNRCLCVPAHTAWIARVYSINIHNQDILPVARFNAIVLFKLAKNIDHAADDFSGSSIGDPAGRLRLLRLPPHPQVAGRPCPRRAHPRRPAWSSRRRPGVGGSLGALPTPVRDAASSSSHYDYDSVLVSWKTLSPIKIPTRRGRHFSHHPRLVAMAIATISTSASSS